MPVKQLYGQDQQSIEGQAQSQLLLDKARAEAGKGGVGREFKQAVPTGFGLSLAAKGARAVEMLGDGKPDTMRNKVDSGHPLGPDLTTDFGKLDADGLNRMRNALSQASSEKYQELDSPDSALPSMLQPSTLTRAASGVATTLPEIFVAGSMGGVPAMAGWFGADAASQAYTSAKDAGLDDTAALKHARNQALIEAGVTLGFHGAGKLAGSSTIGGVETMIANAAKAGRLGSPATKASVKKVLVDGAKSMTAEQAEEMSIGLLSAAQDAYSGVDVNATSPDALKEMAQDTFLQTMMMTGAAQGVTGTMNAASRLGKKSQPGQPSNVSQATQQPAAAPPNATATPQQQPAPVAQQPPAAQPAAAQQPAQQQPEPAAKQDTQEVDSMRQALIANGMNQSDVSSLDDDAIRTMHAAMEASRAAQTGLGQPENESVPPTATDTTVPTKGGDSNANEEVQRQEKADEAQGALSEPSEPGAATEPQAESQSLPAAPKFETYEDFAKEYRDTFNQMMQYKPDEAGSQELATKMADMADAYPEWADRVESEPEAQADAAQTEPPETTSPAPVAENQAPQVDAIGEETPQELAAPENIESTKPVATPQNQDNQTATGQGDLPTGNIEQPKPRKGMGGKKKAKPENLPTGNSDVTTEATPVVSSEAPVISDLPVGKNEIAPAVSDASEDQDLSVASQVKSILDQDGEVSSDSLFAIADKAYGGSRAEGAYGDSRAYDALELGVNQHLAGKTNPTVDEKEAIATVDRIEKLAERLPRHKARTGNKDSLQQFSTPPAYAYAVNWIANVNKSDTALEPSAGNGGLAIHAKNAGARVEVNEIDPARAKNAKSLGFDQVHQEDAEQIDAILGDKLKPTVVVMNPPFSRAGTRMGNKKVVGTDRNHMQAALNLLPDGGRLVAIVGAGLHGQSKGMTDWLSGLPYSVRANVDVAREVYRGYGTEFPTRVLVIDKVPKSESQTVTGSAGSIQELISLLKDVRNDRPAINGQVEPVASPPESESGTRGIGGSNRQPSNSRGATGDVAGGSTEPAIKPENELDSRVPAGSVSSDGGKSDGTAKRNARRKLGGGKSTERSEPASEGTKGSGTDATGEPGGQSGRAGSDSGRVVKAKSVSTDEKKVKELTDSTYEPYRPSVKIAGAKKHPASIVESAAMSAVAFPKVDYEISIPEKTVSGYTTDEGLQVGISDLQLEVVAAAGQAHSQMLPDGERRGFMVGDGTGVGKAREAAGIIMDNWNKGRKKAVWLSKNTKLAPQAVDEWQRIGGSASDVFMQADVGSGEGVGRQEGILFSTYPTITQAASGAATANGKTLSRLDQIVKWVGEDFDGVIIFDEAHQMGEAEESGEGINKKKASQRALAGVDLQAKLPKARVVYMSATSATEVRNLAYAPRLGLWGKGTAFPDRTSFINDISKGGVAAMEKVAGDMKAMGMYLARNISFNDGTPEGTVEFDRITHDLTDDQRMAYDKMSEAWQRVFKRIADALELTGAESGPAKRNAIGQFWSANQRFWNQVVTAMMVPSMITGIERDLAEGRSSIVQLTSTNEAATDRALSKKDKDQELEDIDTSPRYILMDFLERSFPTQRHEEYQDENGNTRVRPVVDSKGNPVHDPAAVRMKEELMDQIGSIQVADRGAIDMLIDHFGEDAVAEITGRSKRILKKNGRAEMQKRSERSTASDKDAFMDGKKRILVFSEAGGTGASYHADKTKKNQQRRSHYVLQPGWRADVAVQGLGRAHRSNQASAPIIHLMQPSLNGYKRFISTIARRLSQLGALTKGQRTAGDSGVFSAADNLESTEAKAAMQKFFDDSVAGRIDGIDTAYLEDRLGLSITKSDGGVKANLPPITQFMNRVLNLPIEEQNNVFEQFQNRLDAMVEAAIANGTLDQGMETIKADSAVKIHESVVSTHPTGAETKHVVLKVKNKIEPRQWDDLQKSGKDKLIDYVRSQKTGKVFGVVDLNQNEQDAQGRMRKLVRLVGVGGSSRNDTTNLKDEGNWTVLSKADAKAAWEGEVSQFPGFAEKELHLLTGALLPVWDRLPEGNAKVRRILTDDGEQILGREIDKSDVKKTLRNLGADYQTEKITPEAAIESVDNGGMAELANGWLVKQSRVEGELLTEIVGPDIRYVDELNKAGAFSRRIAYKVRWFIPTGKNAVQVLKNITAGNREVVEIHEPPSRSGDRKGLFRGKSDLPVGKNDSSTGDRKGLFRRSRVSPQPQQTTSQPVKAETEGGKELVGAIENDIKTGKRSVGRRSIAEFLNRTFNAQMLVSRSQTSRRNPALFRETGAAVFTRSGSWDINIHEAGHAMDAMIQDDNPTWYAQHEQDLASLAADQSSAPFASEDSASEGIAELVRKFVTSDGDNHPMMATFIQMLESTSPSSLAALRDAKAAYSLHASRPYADRRAADRYDVAKDSNSSRSKLADAFWGAMNQIIGNSTLIHRRKRQLWRSITGESKVSMLDPTGVVGSMQLLFSKHAQAMKKVAKSVMSTIDDNASDISRAYSRKLGAEAVKLQAMQGTGLHVYVNGKGLNSLSKRQVRLLKKIGFPLPSKFAGDGEVQQITDKSFEQIKLAIGDGKAWEDFQTAVFDRVASERYRKSGQVYPGLADGLTPDMLDAQWKQAFADNPSWEGHFRDLEKFMNQTLLLGLIGGQYTVKEVVDIYRKWESYAPLQRQVENKRIGRGGSKSDPDFGVRRAKGSHLEYRDMEDSIRDRVSQAVDAYHDNMMILAVRNETRTLGNDKRLSYEVRKGIERTMIPLNMDSTVVARLSPEAQYEIIAAGINRIELDRLGIDHSRMSDGDVIQALNNEGVQPLDGSDVSVAIPGQPVRLIRGRKRPDLPRVVAPWEGGQRKYYLVNDPLMFSLFANSGESIGWVRSLNTFFNGLAAPWKRAYTNSFKFLVRSFLRDPVTSAFLAERRSEMVPGFYLASALIGRITGNGFSKEARESAELMAQALDATTNHTHQTYLGQFIGVLKEGIAVKGWAQMPIAEKAALSFGQAMSVVLKPVDILNYVTGARYLSQQMEILGREGAYIRERRLGKTPAKAQERFMKASGFFAQRQANKSVAGFIRTAGFLNPALQILWQNFEAITNPNPTRRLALNATRAAYLTSIAAAASAINIALIHAMFDDDEEKLNEVLDNMRERDRNERLGNAALFGWFRMPFDYGPAGSIMSAAWNAVEEQLLGVKVDREQRALDLAKRAASLPGFDDLIPPMPKEILEQVRNKTFYTDREIVPGYMLDQYADNPQLQYHWDTPELYKDIGSAIGVSPLRIEHGVRGLTTAIYDDAIRFTDKAYRGNASYKDFPMWRGLVVGEAEGRRARSVQSLEDLNDTYERLDTLLKKDSRLSDADRGEYAKQRESLAIAHAVSNQVADLRDAIRSERDKDLPDYGKIRDLEQQMTKAASDFINNDKIDVASLDAQFDIALKKAYPYKGQSGEVKVGFGAPSKPRKPTVSRMSNPQAWAEYESDLESYDDRLKAFEETQQQAREFVNQYRSRAIGMDASRLDQRIISTINGLDRPKAPSVKFKGSGYKTQAEWMRAHDEYRANSKAYLDAKKRGSELVRAIRGA